MADAGASAGFSVAFAVVECAVVPIVVTGFAVADAVVVADGGDAVGDIVAIARQPRPR